MNFFKVGIIDFFGILCPGVLLFMNLIFLSLACRISISKLNVIFSSNENNFILFMILFVICYLFGFVLRLVSPDRVDKIASIFRRLLNPFKYAEKYKYIKKELKEKTNFNNLNRKEKKEQINILLEKQYNSLISSSKELPKYFWIDEIYPYYFSLKLIFHKNISKGVAKKIISNKEYHNKSIYNFWKTLVAYHDPNLAVLIFQAEAFVRFMSGSFWALVIGIISGTLLLISNAKYSSIGFLLLIISSILSFIILTRFQNQRRREVFILYSAIYAIKDKLDF